MTSLDNPHALPNAERLGTKMYGTFLSSQRRGMCRRISRGVASAERTTTRAFPLLRAVYINNDTQGSTMGVKDEHKEVKNV